MSLCKAYFTTLKGQKMNKYLEQLVNLSLIDKEIDSFEPKIQAVSKPLKDAKQRIAKIEASLAGFDDEVKALSEQRAAANTNIAELSAKLSDSQKKLANAKSDREVKALDIETGLAEERLKAEHADIERIEKILSNKEAFKKECLENKAKEEADLAALSEDINAQIATLEKDRDSVFERKNKLVAQMNQKVMGFYQKIRKWAKNTAVVPVRKQACYGCFMKIYDKTYIAVIKSDEITTCPHCGRILYADEQTTASLPKPTKKSRKESKTES